MRPATVDAWRRGSLWVTLASWPVLLYLVWFVAPDWSGLADVSAPLTRKVLFFHPASAWAAFAAYFVVFALSIAVLNERDARYDAPARAAAEVGFWFNTVALATGTLWGIQEWSESGRASLATVYSTAMIYASLKSDYYHASAFSHRIDTLQLGVAPYAHDYSTLATWFVIQARRYTGEIYSGTELAFLLRLFKRGAWLEAGPTTDGKVQAMLMFNF